MSQSKNILVVLKRSKLNYLIDKYGIDTVKNSYEYSRLQDSKDLHARSCDLFLSALDKLKSKGQKVEIIEDNFLKNEILSNKLEKETSSELIFSLGGDGTFLRTAHFANHKNQILIGLNTDKYNSVGFYCPIKIEEINAEENLQKIFSSQYETKIMDKISIQTRNSQYYFLNDLYFGEKFMGRVSKYNLKIDGGKSEVIKSSGIILSTFAGYSGWIRNANTIAFKKFSYMMKQNSREIENEELLKMYRQYCFNSSNNNQDSIFYFVREPSLKSNFPDVEKHIEYLNFMEGSAKAMSIDNFCYEGILILDGSFTIPVDYNEQLQVIIGNKNIKTLSKLL
jgi:NAD kinase